MDHLVLIVEDNDNIANLEKRHLEKDGFRVLTAATGGEGLGRIGSADIDLIVIDYHLPDMSGIEFMERVRALGKNIPTIVVTGSGNENIAVTSLKLGALDYVVKGTETIKKLPETCREALKRHGLEEENKRLMTELKTVNVELTEANRKLDELSKVDDLTGVFNRRHLMDALSYELWRSHRYRCPLSFAIFDLDHFKKVNDTFGHITGDEVLRQFASILKGNMRKIDIVGRYGGEEFGVILSGTPLGKAILFCNRLRESISSETFGGAGGGGAPSIKITASAGVACLTEGMNVESLVDEADRSLYEAKRTGRDRVVSLQNDAKPAVCCIDECDCRTEGDRPAD